MSTSFTRLADLLPKALHSHGIASGVHAAQVVNRWPEALQKIAGLASAEHATAQHLKNGILSIHVANSSVAHTLQNAKMLLISELNREPGTIEVKEIRFIQR